MTRITAISDTHTKHNQITKDLPGGDIIICSGDISSMGHEHEVNNFCKWFDKLNNYDHKIFIAGNHDFIFEKNSEKAYEIINSYKWIDYLQDNLIEVGTDVEDLIKIWGTPWQPEFCNWAFNLPKNGLKLAQVWNNVPEFTDILISHGPPFGYCDMVVNENINLGCQLLINRIKTIKPKINIFGHIHSGYGYKFDGDTHFINASVLNEQYSYTNKPLTFDWDKNTNELNFL